MDVFQFIDIRQRYQTRTEHLVQLRQYSQIPDCPGEKYYVTKRILMKWNTRSQQWYENAVYYLIITQDLLQNQFLR